MGVSMMIIHIVLRPHSAFAEVVGI